MTTTGCGATDDGPADRARTPRGPSSANLRAQLANATNTDEVAFPPTRGRTLQQIADSLDGAGPQLAFASTTLVPGKQRLAFGLIDAGNRILYAPSALYVADAPDKPARGPYPAPADLLITDPPFRSRQAASESDPFAAVYETEVDLPKPGRQAVLSVSRVNDGFYGATGSLRVRPADEDRVPDVGDRAPQVDTDTVTSAAGNLDAIDTRRPNDSMHTENLADVIAKKPVALLFATPQLCQSRVCGPVVDVAEQLKDTYGDRMAFIHQEVYVDNDPNKGLRRALKAYGLRTEPWLFVIDANGRIAERVEGSFGFTAFERAIRAGLADG
jgi:hypothetical protein